MSIDQELTRSVAVSPARPDDGGSSGFFLELVDSVGALTDGVVDQILAGVHAYS